MKIKDKVFNEIFGTYYNILTEIVNSEPKSENEIMQLIQRKCFNESDLLLQNRFEAFPFLDEVQGKWQSVLENKSVLPLTSIEKSWLKAIIADPRINLFIDICEKDRLNSLLTDVEPLFDYSDFYYFDKFADGDDYASEVYCSNFRNALKAIAEQKTVFISYESKRHKTLEEYCLPIKLEYSPKDDKFRLIAITESEEYGQNETVYNLASIREIQDAPDQFSISVPKELPHKVIEEPIELQIFNERNAVERFMFEFSSYKKESVIDKETGNCTTKVFCHLNEMSEMLIKILAFGVTIKVLGPGWFVEKIKKRIHRQHELLE